jgi:predicted nucleotidyltransferase
MNFDLASGTVFLTLSGSHAYGMATPTSDHDYKGIVIPPMSSYIGFIDKFEHSVDLEVYKKYPVGLLKDDPRVEGADPTVAPDMQVMEITKFVRLALHNNPSVIETLFTDEAEVLVCDPVLKPLVDNRDKMLSKQAKARFCGYAVSQLNRIKRHKRWLDNPPQKKPERKDYGLPDQGLLSPDQIGAANSLIQKEIDEFMVDQTHLPEDVKIELGAMLGKSMRATWQALHTDVPYPVGDDQRFESTEDALYWGAAKDQGFTDNFLEVLVREKRYRTAKREWDQYQTWKRQRNEKRAELEKQFGFDTKHASHLVRLLRMAREILEEGVVRVKRPDAEELLAIRRGAWSYEQIVEFAEKEDEALIDVVKNCSLPKVPDMNFFDDMVRDIVLQFNR